MSSSFRVCPQVPMTDIIPLDLKFAP